MTTPLVQWQIEALALGLIVLFLGVMFYIIISIVFPPDDKGPRGGGFVE